MPQLASVCAFRHQQLLLEANIRPGWQCIRAQLHQRGMGQTKEPPVQMGAFRQVRGKCLQQRQCTAEKGCTTALSGFWFCSKEDGSGTHMVKTTRITTKASDHQKNSSVEDSRDERTRWQSSSLTVLIVLNNRQFRTPSSFRERLQILKTLTVCNPYSPAERSLER